MITCPPNLSDQLTDDLRQQHIVIQQLQSQLDRFGYAQVDTPLIEEADSFLIKAGDAAISRLVTFDLPGSTLCLRPEFTVPAARVYIEHFQTHQGPVRLQFAGPILQYGNLGHNHLRQQNAVGAELLDEYGPAADAEIIALAARMLLETGAAHWQLIIGHSGLIERFLDRYALNRQMHRFVLEWLPQLHAGQDGLERARAALEQMHDSTRAASLGLPDDLHDTETALQAMLQAAPQRGPLAGRSREDIARRLLSKQQQGDQFQKAMQALQDFSQMLTHAHSPSALLAHIHDTPMKRPARELMETFELLNAYQLPAEQVTFDLSFTRNLDYYTGIVFEYRSQDPAAVLLGGGGRYDELVRLLGASRDVPAVGFMLYVDSILQARPDAPTVSHTPITHLLIVGEKPEQAAALIPLATRLREAGFTVTASLQGNQSPAPLTGSQYTHMVTLQPPDSLVIHELDTAKKHHIPLGDFESLRQLLEAEK